MSERKSLDDRDEALRVESELIAAHPSACNIIKRDMRRLPPPKCPPTGIRMPRFILAALEKLAQADDRTVSYMINKIIAEYLRARKLIK
jgi:hypothetical protein